MTAPLPAPAPAPTAGLLTLEAGGSLVALDAARGGHVTRLRLAGRDWLAAGGLEETLALGDGPPAPLVDAATARGGGDTAVTRAAGPGYTYERTVTAQADGAVRVEYALTAAGDAPLALHWTARPHLALVPNTRLDLPVAARVRVLAEQHVALGGPGALHRWPVLRVGARDGTPFGPREVDFTFPALAPRRFGDGGRAGYACDLLLELPRPASGTVRLGVEQDGARLEFTVDPALVPLAALRVDAADGAAGLVAVGPTLGILPALAGVAGGAAPALSLAPGEVRRWSVLWRGRAAPAGA